MKRKIEKRKFFVASIIESRSVSAASRVRRVQRICASLELDPLAGGIIVDLLERIEAMQRDMERLLAQIGD